MKNALVLGVTGSLGTSIASKLLTQGYNVIGSYHNEKSLAMFDRDKIRMIRLDMGEKSSIDLFLKEIENIGSLDFFTNTISNTLTTEKFEKIDLEVFQEDFEINFFNYIYLLKKIIPKLNQGSNIVIILTSMIDEPIKNFSSHISSKYALLGLMKCLKKELEGRKIRINAVSPHKMNTRYLWNMRVNGKVSNIPKAIKDKQIATENFTSTEKVADKIVEIINDQSVNGQNLLIK